MSEKEKIIYKYTLRCFQTSHNIPKDARFLSAQWDEKEAAPCIWLLVHPDNETEERIFVIYGTGIPIPYGTDYIGTAIDQEDGLVWHVFEERKEVENHE